MRATARLDSKIHIEITQRKIIQMVKAWQVIASSLSSQRKMRRRNIRRRNVKLLVAPQSLPNDVVEEIFLRLPVETLIRLKCLSKQWRDTINSSSSFAERHLKIAERRSSHLKTTIMVISEENPFQGVIDNKRRPDTDLSFNTICLETSSVLSSALINLPHGLSYFPIASTSCDGLFCIHSPLTQAVYVVNPATRWIRQLPPSGFQISILNLNLTLPLAIHVKSVYHLAFVKAAANNDYKLIWFYNNNIFEGIHDDDCGLVCGTKCEVFDFRANAWRYLPCTPSYKLYRDQTPAYANGSVYWFTEPHQGEIKVISLDINTEKFGFLPRLNRDIARSDPRRINMCTLDNRLCMSKREPSTLVQDIWRLKSSSSAKESSWEKIYTIDLLSCTSSKTEFRDEFDWIRKDVVEPCAPVAICEKTNEILLSHRYSRTVVKYDPVNKSMSLVFHRPLSKRFVPYFQSLISNI
ncbi:unnamed protein product [Cochlearia groenlandica]